MQYKRDSLLRFTSRLFDQLSGVRPASIRHLLANALAGLGERADVPHAHLYLIRRNTHGQRTASLAAQWSSENRTLDRAKLQNLEVSHFGLEAAEELEAGTTVFTSLSESGVACSRLVSSILVELQSPSYVMIPIQMGRSWRGLLAFAHSGGAMHGDPETRQVMQLAGKVMISSLLAARRELGRKARHRQWKRIADGACDFAMSVSRELEIMEVIPFRRKELPTVTGLRLCDMFDRPSAEQLTAATVDATNSLSPRTLDVRTIEMNGQQESFAVRVELAPEPEVTTGVGSTTFPRFTLYLTSNDRERAHAEELQLLRLQLDRATRLSQLGNIATEFAHQLKQPLQSVANHAFTLRTRLGRLLGDRTSLLSCVDNIESQISHAGDVISSVQGFMQNRQMEQRPESLSRIIQHAVLLMQPIADGAGVRMRTDDEQGLMSAESALLVEVDRVQTTHVLINLLMNAIEACSSAGIRDAVVSIGVLRGTSDRTIQVAVSDNGPGIQPELLIKVFDRFYTSKREGFGIGLAICRDVIERQSGSITVANNSQRGCTFSFTLQRRVEDDDTASISK